MEEDALFKDDLDFRNPKHITHPCTNSKCPALKLGAKCSLIRHRCIAAKIEGGLWRLHRQWHLQLTCLK